MQDGQEQVRLPGELMSEFRCGVIGHPAEHSLSPALHRAAYAELGLDWDYDAHDVAPGELDDFVGHLDGSWRGLSVTMPHKEAIRGWGQGDDLVELTGVANTLVLNNPEFGRPVVRNTDVGGFLTAFAAAGIESADSATIIGAGATARSAVVALREMGVERLLVLARTPAKAAGLKELASNRLGMVCGVRALEAGQVLPADLLVSTVPAQGVAELAEPLADSAQAVFDVSYHPWPTALASAAEKSGRPVVTGLDLLAGQADGQVRLMTGGEVGFELLRSAGQEELRRRGQL